jgi:hypothetical protein
MYRYVCRLHGTENLLHRAAREGNVTIVTELLASGYRNIAAKVPYKCFSNVTFEGIKPMVFVNQEFCIPGM